VVDGAEGVCPGATQAMAGGADWCPVWWRGTTGYSPVRWAAGANCPVGGGAGGGDPSGGGGGDPGGGPGRCAPGGSATGNCLV